MHAHRGVTFRYLGQPQYQVPTDLFFLFKDCCSLAFPGEPDINEFCRGFNESISNFRKGDANRHFKVLRKK